MNSHIIPEFVYKPLYPAKPQHQRFRSARIGEMKLEWKQNGFKEPMLCWDCEQFLSKHYEDYANRNFFSKQLPSPTLHGKTKRIEVKGLEYKQMKLFMLSILWRAGVANHEFFKHVQLGPHETTLRHMLLNENPGGVDDYGFVTCTIKFNGSDFKDFFVEPTLSRLAEVRSYRFVFSGLQVDFLVASHKMNSPIRRCFLQPSGEWLIYETEFAEHPRLCDIFNAAKDSFGSRPYE